MGRVLPGPRVPTQIPGWAPSSAPAGPRRRLEALPPAPRPRRPAPEGKRHLLGNGAGSRPTLPGLAAPTRVVTGRRRRRRTQGSRVARSPAQAAAPRCAPGPPPPDMPSPAQRPAAPPGRHHELALEDKGKYSPTVRTRR